MRSKIQAVREAVEAALKAVESAHGFKINATRMTYSPEGSFTLKLEGGLVGAGGTVVTKEVSAFKALCGVYGFKPEHLGATFTAMGQTFKIEGLRTKAGKRPILATNVSTGKKFVFPERDVLRALGVLTQPATVVPPTFRGGFVSQLEPVLTAGQKAAATRKANAAAAALPTGTGPIPPAALTKFLTIANHLSPENLSCDGEASRAHIITTRNRLNAEWAALEVSIGRKVTEEQVYAAENREVA